MLKFGKKVVKFRIPNGGGRYSESSGGALYCADDKGRNEK